MSVSMSGEAVCNNRQDVIAGFRDMFGPNTKITEKGDTIVATPEGSWRGITATKKDGTYRVDWDSDESHRFFKMAGRNSGAGATLANLLTQHSAAAKYKAKALSRKWKVKQKTGKNNELILELERSNR